jgi:flagellar basal-body rod protein FlgC
MVYPVHSSVSAVNAFSKKIQVTANNVANVNTDGFKKSRATLSEEKTGGVKATITQVDTPGYPKQITKDGSVEEVESSNVDLTEEITESMSSQRGHEANLKAINVQDEMIGTLLDTIG